MNVWKKNSSWKPIFSTSKLQHVAGSVNLLVPSGRGCMFDCDKLWLQGSTYIHVFSLCDVSDVSLTHTQHSFQIPRRNHSVKRRRKKIGERKGSVSQHWSEPLQEFKLQPLMIAGSTSWAPFCFRISSKEYTSWNILPLQLKQLRIASIILWVDDDK